MIPRKFWISDKLYDILRFFVSKSSVFSIVSFSKNHYQALDLGIRTYEKYPMLKGMLECGVVYAP